MKEALCFVFLIVFVVFGWKQSYRHHFESIWNGSVGLTGKATPAPSPGTSARSPQVSNPSAGQTPSRPR